MANRPARSIDDYIEQFPPETQKVLQELRALIRKTEPRVTERISYAMPTFDLNGHYLVYFAGWKKHISLYPITGGLAKAFKEELKPYKSGKGTIQLPLGQPIPKDLIRRIVKFRAKELAAKET